MFNQHWAPSNLKIPDPLISSVQSEAYLVTCRLKRKYWPLSSYLQELLVAMGKVGGSVIKNLPANARESDSNLCQEDPLEKEMATHSSILAWNILWTEEPGGLYSVGLQRVRQDLATKQQQWRRLMLITVETSPLQSQSICSARYF